MEIICKSVYRAAWKKARSLTGWGRNLELLSPNYDRRRRLSNTSHLHGSSKSNNNNKKKTPVKPHQAKLEYKTPTRKPLPTSSSSSSSKKPPTTNPLRYRTIPIVFGSLTLFAFSCYTSYLYISFSRSAGTPSTPSSSSPSSQPDVSARYDSIARTFDTSVDSTERVLRIAALRRKLAARAQGDVLEVSIGTGRNLEYYEWDDDDHNNNKKKKPGKAGEKGKGKVKSLTALDKSAEMLDVARAKLETLGGRAEKKNIRWIVTDASLPPLPAAPNATQKYDTIIQTMGLCSVSDPVQLLRNLGSSIKEEEGRILLLEHGRGNWKWLNNLLDRFAEDHAREFGCWWNRDLKGIVRESGLDVVDMYSVWWHGGTTWWVELKKSRAAEHDVA